MTTDSASADTTDDQGNSESGAEKYVRASDAVTREFIEAANRLVRLVVARKSTFRAAFVQIVREYVHRIAPGTPDELRRLSDRNLSIQMARAYDARMAACAEFWTQALEDLELKLQPHITVEELAGVLHGKLVFGLAMGSSNDERGEARLKATAEVFLMFLAVATGGGSAALDEGDQPLDSGSPGQEE